MWNVGRWFGAVLIAGAAGIQLIRPARTNPPTDQTRTLIAAMHLPDDVRRVMDRACRDCHSHETRWPWYSNVAPVSWFVIDHVNHGRRHFNYSDWASHDEEYRSGILANVCKMVRKGQMPIPSYTWMHPESRLTDADAAVLCNWVK